MMLFVKNIKEEERDVMFTVEPEDCLDEFLKFNIVNLSLKCSFSYQQIKK